jgi:hypothetical protein
VIVTVVVVVGCSPDTKPALTVATAVFEEVQVAELVMSTVPPLVKVPVAVNCTVPVGPMLLVDGVTRMLLSGKMTVAVVVPVIFAEFAVIVAVPLFTAVKTPVVLIEATVRSEELQKRF